MAKKKAAPKVTEPELAGYINLSLYQDGSYDLDTQINPQYIVLFANMFADMVEGKINDTIIQRYAASDNQGDQEIAVFLNNFLKLLKTQSKPLIMPDKVFRKNKPK